jgi:hypothetical protein
MEDEKIEKIQKIVLIAGVILVTALVIIKMGLS